MLTIREAWLKIVEYLETAVQNPRNGDVVIPWGYCVKKYGICDLINGLVARKIIDYDLSVLMFKVMDQNQPANCRLGDYWWPHTWEGLEARIKFCKTQAETIYDICLWNNESRSHRKCNYKNALEMIYNFQPNFVNVKAYGEDVCKNEPWYRALVFIVKHYNPNI